MFHVKALCPGGTVLVVATGMRSHRGAMNYIRKHGPRLAGRYGMALIPCSGVGK